MSSTPKKKARPNAAKTKSKPKAVRRTKAAKKVVQETAKVKPKKTAVEKKEAAVKAAPKPPPSVLGARPEAWVSSRHLDSMIDREARGFSFGELSSAGVTLEVAKRQELSIDVRRRSVVNKNVQALKGWIGSPSEVAVAAVAKKK